MLVVMIGRCLVLLALVACHSVADGPQPITSEPPPTQGPPRTAPTPEAAPGKLGASCTPGQRDERYGVDPCGAKQRIALEMNPRQAVFTREVPCTLGASHTRAPNEITSCIEGDRLFVQSMCQMCRVPLSGWAAVAQLDELTPAGARDLQGLLHRPTGSALSTTAAWKQALAR